MWYIFEVQCVVYTNNIIHFRIAMFQVPSDDLWLVTALLDSLTIDHLSDRRLWEVRLITGKAWSRQSDIGLDIERLQSEVCIIIKEAK